MFDNSFSLLRSKRVAYRLALLSHAQSARRRRAELEREVRSRLAREAELAKEVEALGGRIEALHAQAEGVAQTLRATHEERKRNRAALTDAEARLETFATV